MNRVCNNCKVEKKVTSDNFSRDKNKKEGFRYTCKLCTKELSKSHNIVSKRSLIKVKLKSYKEQDFKRKRSNHLTAEFIADCLSKSCIYCGYPATGLDRIDNNIGHIESNCVPCCKECNVARNNLFSHEEMKVLGLAIKNIKDKRS